MTKKRQVIALRGDYHYIEDAYKVVRNQFVETQTLQDHPDMDEYEMADSMLEKLRDTGVFSAQTEAILAYNKAHEKILQFSEDEIDRSDEL